MFKYRDKKMNLLTILLIKLQKFEEIMWVFYYKSEERINQIASQIDPNIPFEKNIKNSKGGKVNMGGDAKTSKLMNVIGLELNGNLNAEGNLDNTAEIKYKVLDEVMIDLVCTHLSNKENYTYLSNESENFEKNSIQKLVKFKGKFFPQVSGESPREKFAEVESCKFLIWKCKYYESYLKIGISLEYLVSKSPLYTCLADNIGLDFQGYGLFNGRTAENEIVIIPLFFGVDF